MQLTGCLMFIVLMLATFIITGIISPSTYSCSLLVVVLMLATFIISGIISLRTGCSLLVVILILAISIILGFISPSTGCSLLVVYSTNVGYIYLKFGCSTYRKPLFFFYYTLVSRINQRKSKNIYKHIFLVNKI